LRIVVGGDAGAVAAAAMATAAASMAGG
jgi:hypothetical protein